MSELINAQFEQRDLRWQLLTTVSAAALLVVALAPGESQAADQDVDRPTVWIELGAQMERVGGQGDPFSPGFVAANPNSPVLNPVSPIQAQNPPPFSFGEEGRISFQPGGSDWSFSAAIRYGRSSNFRHVQHETDNPFFKYIRNGKPYGNIDTKVDFADTHADHDESHAILDFTAGKDVGLGMFGKDGSSVVSFGVRFAQFVSNASFDARARPDLEKKYAAYPSVHATYVLPHFHAYHASGQSLRSFRGIGPSLAWSGSAPVAGNTQDGQIALDFGANAAVLFGKQKTHVQHHESGHYESIAGNLSAGQAYDIPTYDHSGGHDSVRSVTVPNIGGFAGGSYRIENFKMSLGYRADFFFGAMDVGIDARKSATLGFYGPFASVSVGIGG